MTLPICMSIVVGDCSPVSIFVRDFVQPCLRSPLVEQPRSGLLWLCKGCGDALVGRGVYDSGFCRGCRDDVVEGAR